MDAEQGRWSLNAPDLVDSYRTVRARAGGAIRIADGFDANDPNAAECRGYTDCSPDFKLNWRAVSLLSAVPELRFFFIPDADIDTTLVVLAPDGFFYCSDDYRPSDGLDPLVYLRPAPQGEYVVWVGTFAERASTVGTLFISRSRSHTPTQHPRWMCPFGQAFARGDGPRVFDGVCYELGYGGLNVHVDLTLYFREEATVAVWLRDVASGTLIQAAGSNVRYHDDFGNAIDWTRLLPGDEVRRYRNLTLYIPLSELPRRLEQVQLELIVHERASGYVIETYETMALDLPR